MEGKIQRKRSGTAGSLLLAARHRQQGFLRGLQMNAWACANQPGTQFGAEQNSSLISRTSAPESLLKLRRHKTFPLLTRPVFNKGLGYIVSYISSRVLITIITPLVATPVHPSARASSPISARWLRNSHLHRMYAPDRMDAHNFVPLRRAFFPDLNLVHVSVSFQRRLFYSYFKTLVGKEVMRS